MEIKGINLEQKVRKVIVGEFAVSVGDVVVEIDPAPHVVAEFVGHFGSPKAPPPEKKEGGEKDDSGGKTTG